MLHTFSPVDEKSKIRSIIDCYEAKSQFKNVYNSKDNPKMCTNIYCGHSNSLNNRVKNQPINNKCNSAVSISDSEDSDIVNEVLDIIKKIETDEKERSMDSKPKIRHGALFYSNLIIEKVIAMAQIKFQCPSCVSN